MLALLLFAILVFVVAGIIGFVVHSLFWLFILAIVLVVLTVLGGPSVAAGSVSDATADTPPSCSRREHRRQIV